MHGHDGWMLLAVGCLAMACGLLLLMMNDDGSVWVDTYSCVRNFTSKKR